MPCSNPLSAKLRLTTLVAITALGSVLTGCASGPSQSPDRSATEKAARLVNEAQMLYGAATIRSVVRGEKSVQLKHLEDLSPDWLTTIPAGWALTSTAFEHRLNDSDAKSVCAAVNRIAGVPSTQAAENAKLLFACREDSSGLRVMYRY